MLIGGGGADGEGDNAGHTPEEYWENHPTKLLYVILLFFVYEE